jgi:ankyrin repeat protein
VKGHAEVVEYLVGQYVALARANEGTREDVVELLDRADQRGRTALWDACRFGHLDVVRVLLGAGADPSVQNDEGLDALAIAQSVRQRSSDCMLRQPAG